MFYKLLVFLLSLSTICNKQSVKEPSHDLTQSVLMLIVIAREEVPPVVCRCDITASLSIALS